MTGRDLHELVVFLNNTAPLEIVELVYGGPDPEEGPDPGYVRYLTGKAEYLRADVLGWLSSLDADRRAILAAAATGAR